MKEIGGIPFLSTHTWILQLIFLYLSYFSMIDVVGGMRKIGADFPEGLLLSLLLPQCDCQSLTSAVGLPIGLSATRRCLIGCRAQCGTQALFSLLSSNTQCCNAGRTVTSVLLKPLELSPSLPSSPYRPTLAVCFLSNMADAVTQAERTRIRFPPSL